MPPINPITVSRLKTFGLLGHSNADGWAPLQDTIESNNELNPKVFTPTDNPDEAYYKNAYVITAPQPYPSDLGVPVSSSLSDSEWLEMTVANTLTPAEPHPHESPFLYPNNRGSCYPNYSYQHYQSALEIFNSYGFQGINHSAGRGILHGVEIPFMWLWRAYWGEQVGMNKVAFSSSFVLPAETGIPATPWINLWGTGGKSPYDEWDTPKDDGTQDFAQGFTPDSPYADSNWSYIRSAIDTNQYDWHAWWTPSDVFDFAPQTDRLYKAWYDKSAAGQARLDELGNNQRLDYRCIILWMGDNDAAARTSNALRDGMKPTMKALIKRIRSDIATNDWSELAEKEIPIILMGIHPAYISSASPADDTVGIINAIYDEIAAEDEFVTVVPTASLTTLTENGQLVLGVGNTSHFGSDGYMTAAADIFNAWTNMLEDPLDALDLDETKTVGQAKDQVRLYYNKSRANTDLSDELVLQHLNGAMFHVFNHVGDNAWWLRRRKSIALTAGHNTITTLPKYVKRLLFIEDPGDMNYPVKFEQIGHGEGGALQINMRERGSGTYMCQFITNPRELTGDGQVVPAPRQVFEWIVVEACRRIAAGSSNAPLTAHFAGEARQLMEDCMRNAGQTQRSKNDTMKTQRRRPMMGYSRGNRRYRWGRHL